MLNVNSNKRTVAINPALTLENSASTTGYSPKRRLFIRVGIAITGVLILLVITTILLGGIALDGLAAGEPAPNFSRTDLQGNLVQLSDYQGQPVMLTFWSPDCEACREELPTLQTIAADPQRTVTLITVVSKVPTDHVQNFVQEAGLTFPVVVDEAGTITADYKVQGIPFTYFINPDGKVDHTMIGAGAAGELQNNLFNWSRTCNIDEVCK
ncbi:MAG: redoxin domain-containing protein [Caldilineaceae bacterium]